MKWRIFFLFLGRVISSWYHWIPPFQPMQPLCPHTRLDEGDYYITFAGSGPYHGHGLFMKSKEDLWLSPREKIFWRLYYPQFESDYFVLQMVWPGEDGDGHPWYGWHAAVFGDYVGLEPIPTFWIAQGSHHHNIFYLMEFNPTIPSKLRWLGKTRKTPQVLLTWDATDRNLFHFEKLN